MKDSIQIKNSDLVKIFKMMESIHDLLHQPMKYENKKVVRDFVKNNYKDIKELYYDTLWNYLPNDIQEQIENE